MLEVPRVGALEVIEVDPPSCLVDVTGDQDHTRSHREVGQEAPEEGPVCQMIDRELALITILG